MDQIINAFAKRIESGQFNWPEVVFGLGIIGLFVLFFGIWWTGEWPWKRD